MANRNERDFLHDLSSPLGALQLHLEHLLDLFRKNYGEHAELKRIEKAVDLVHKTGKMISTRRQELKEELETQIEERK